MVHQPGKGNDGIQRHTNKGNWGDNTSETALCTENQIASKSIKNQMVHCFTAETTEVELTDLIWSQVAILKKKRVENDYSQALQYKLANDATSWPI